MSYKIDDLFESLLHELQRELRSKVEILHEKKVEELEKADSTARQLEKRISKATSAARENYEKYQKQIDQTEKKREELLTKIESLSSEQEDTTKELKVEQRRLEKELEEHETVPFDPKIADELSLFRCFDLSTRLSLDAARAVAKTPEGKNYIAFDRIKSGYETRFELAATAKEKRNVIIELHDHDWAALGVTALPFPEVQIIRDGQIQLSPLKLTSTPPKK